MGQLTDIKVPDIGDYKDVPVIEVLVKDGDSVASDAPLLVLESDKATMEVPSPGSGTIRSLSVKVGDRISSGTVIGQLELEGAASEPASEPTPAAAKAPGPAAPDPGPAPAPASAGRLAVMVPDIGDFKGIPVIEVLVKDGDAVEKEQALLVLESDKATMEVPAPAAGVVRDLKVKAGDTVSKGDPVCALETTAPVAAAPESRPDKAVAKPQPNAAPNPAPLAAAAAPAAVAPTPPLALPAAELPHAGPATRKFARELGVELAAVTGTGVKGRITVEDVQAHVKKALASPASPTVSSAPAAGGTGTGIPPIPAQDFSLFGAIETQPLARIRKLSAAHLSRAWLNIPHVTQTDEADITELEAFRKSLSDELTKSGGPKLTLLPFIMKAVATALKAYPDFNSSLSADGNSLIVKKYCNLGFAADTPNGLVVPVVREVWSKGLTALAEETAVLAKSAREGKLKPDEMKGGCFSISSLGGIGGSHFTPIVNAPEVGILGVSRSAMKPVWDGLAFQPRLMVPLSLSYDHRVIDGAYAARFMVELVKLLGDLRRLLL